MVEPVGTITLAAVWLRINKIPFTLNLIFSGLELGASTALFRKISIVYACTGPSRMGSPAGSSESESTEPVFGRAANGENLHRVNFTPDSLKLILKTKSVISLP